MANAEDVEQIIHSFRDTHHLRVGIRDLVRQDDIVETHRALSDVAEVCLGEIVNLEAKLLANKLGHPLDGEGQIIPMTVVAMGKLGGREPNYHSDLDLVFLYNSEGKQKTVGGSDPTSHQDFFSRLAANVTRRISRNGRYGKLYDIDLRLRPTGKSGSAAVSNREFRRYFREGSAQLWERLALCKARTLFHEMPSTIATRDLLHEILGSHPWTAQDANDILEMRLRVQEGAKPTNIKRGVGGTMDVEFIVQMLQLKYAASHPTVLQTNTIDAASQLHQHRLLSTDDFEFLKRSYRMLRWVEARLRLMNIPYHRHDVPTEPHEQKGLAYLLDYDKPELLLNEIQHLRENNRQRLLRLFQVHGTAE